MAFYLKHYFDPDFKHEKLAVPHKLFGQGIGVFEVLLSGDREASGDPAEQGNRNKALIAKTGKRGVGAVVTGEDLESAWAIRVAPDVAAVFEDAQLVGDRGGRVQSDLFADLSHGWWVAALLGGGSDDLKNPALPHRQAVGTGGTVGHFADLGVEDFGGFARARRSCRHSTRLVEQRSSIKHLFDASGISWPKTPLRAPRLGE